MLEISFWSSILKEGRKNEERGSNCCGCSKKQRRRRKGSPFRRKAQSSDLRERESGKKSDLKERPNHP